MAMRLPRLTSARVAEEPLLFRVGQDVVLGSGLRRSAVRVLEDRGNLGPRGLRLLRVAPLADDGGADEEQAFEAFQEDLASP